MGLIYKVVYNGPIYIRQQHAEENYTGNKHDIQIISNATASEYNSGLY